MNYCMWWIPCTTQAHSRIDWHTYFSVWPFLNVPTHTKLLRSECAYSRCQSAVLCSKQTKHRKSVSIKILFVTVSLKRKFWSKHASEDSCFEHFECKGTYHCSNFDFNRSVFECIDFIQLLIYTQLHSCQNYLFHLIRINKPSLPIDVFSNTTHPCVVMTESKWTGDTLSESITSGT